MEIKTNDLDVIEIFDVDDDDDSNAAKVIPASPGAEFAANFKSLRYTEQLQAIQKLRENLHISSCPLVYNPACSFHFNLALKINSINLTAFKKTESSEENLLLMGNAVLRVHPDCDSHEWLTYIIGKLHQTDVPPSKDLEYFYSKIWGMRKKVNFPSEIVELIVRRYPTVLEDLMIELTARCTETDERSLKSHLTEEFKEDGIKAWVLLCSKSPLVFQYSASILQTLLHFSRGDKRVLALAQTFHAEVRARCDFVQQLFPGDLALLVRKLESGKLDDAEVLNELSDLLVFDRATGQCLLTFFPRWLPRLLVFSVNNTEARIISQEFGDWHL